MALLSFFTPQGAVGTALPSTAGLRDWQRPSTELADAYVTTLPAQAIRDPERLARFLFGHPAPWMRALMSMRDLLVSAVGLKTGAALSADEQAARGERVGMFRIYFRDRDEIVLGEDDRHLDFRVSVLLQVAQENADQATLTVSTVVHTHNRLGRLYLAMVAPFHRFIVPSMLCRAERRGWPVEASR